MEILVKSLCESIRGNMVELFLDYVGTYGQSTTQSEIIPYANFSQSQSIFASTNTKISSSVLKERFKKYKSDIGLGGSKKSDLDLYLSELVIEEEGEFDILRWWKLNSKRFPLISRMARDILTIPISTVASEYASSTRG